MPKGENGKACSRVRAVSEFSTTMFTREGFLFFSGGAKGQCNARRPNRVNCRSRLTIALRIHCTPQWERNHAKAVRPNKSALQRYQPFRSAEIPRSASGMHRYQPAEKKRTLMTAKQETGEKKNLTGDTSARRHRKIAI